MLGSSISVKNDIRPKYIQDLVMQRPDQLPKPGIFEILTEGFFAVRYEDLLQLKIERLVSFIGDIAGKVNGAKALHPPSEGHINTHLH